MLSVMFFFTGIEMNIRSSVYGTCIGFTHAFGEDRKALATLSGISVAVGEVVGGVLFGIFGKLTVKHGRIVKLSSADMCLNSLGPSTG